MSKKEVEVPVVSSELARSFEIAKHTIQGIRTMLNTDFYEYLKTPERDSMDNKQFLFLLARMSVLGYKRNLNGE
ncbi:hypothetical protein M3M39_05040 [Fructilactobacillus hinvesii]|uniref:Uncharacterized protein n=1 Tax=Fructilactobacillus hinvesii TaxID=2940300 RepID=A0ABY5BQT8_9LACO|nr:hypothetical protein [Fructilactobacillus hinvesii]USS87489.1 hypothetical protein M3M39_05040 [Fructilactobacillus hinvesii]